VGQAPLLAEALVICRRINEYAGTHYSIEEMLQMMDEDGERVDNMLTAIGIAERAAKWWLRWSGNGG
jgi:hypothetical protein